MQKRSLAVLLFALGLVLAVTPAAAQNLIVTTCGTVPAAVATLTAGNQGPTFINTSGQACISGTFSATVAPNASALTTTSVTVTNSSATFLAASTATKYLLCKNESATASIALNFANGTAALNTAGNITLPPGASIVFEQSQVPTGAITGISSAASSPATCLSS